MKLKIKVDKRPVIFSALKLYRNKDNKLRLKSVDKKFNTWGLRINNYFLAFYDQPIKD